MENTIINIKAWSRPIMLKETLQKLSECYNIKNYNIIISIDGPNTPYKISNFEAAINKSNIKENSKSVDIIYHDKNIGCAGNMKFCFIESFKNKNVNYMIHLEDDTIPGKDFLLFMEAGYNYMKEDEDIFAICPFIRKTHLTEHNIKVSLENDIDKIFYRNNFEPGGGFGMNRNQWNKIEKDRGVFGVIGECGNDLRGDEWLENLKRKGGKITDKGSWAWPFRQMYLNNKKVIFPKISRTQNIGDVQGLFNPGITWHKTKIFNPKWVENEYYKDFDFKTINYQLLTN